MSLQVHKSNSPQVYKSTSLHDHGSTLDAPYITRAHSLRLKNLLLELRMSVCGLVRLSFSLCTATACLRPVLARVLLVVTVHRLAHH